MKKAYPRVFDTPVLREMSGVEMKIELTDDAVPSQSLQHETYPSVGEKRSRNRSTTFNGWIVVLGRVDCQGHMRRPSRQGHHRAGQPSDCVLPSTGSGSQEVDRRLSHGRQTDSRLHEAEQVREEADTSCSRDARRRCIHKARRPVPHEDRQQVWLPSARDQNRGPRSHHVHDAVGSVSLPTRGVGVHLQRRRLRPARR